MKLTEASLRLFCFMYDATFCIHVHIIFRSIAMVKKGGKMLGEHFGLILYDQNV